MEFKICKKLDTSRNIISIKGELILIEVPETTKIIKNGLFYKPLVISDDEVDIDNLILIDDRNNVKDKHEYSIKTVEFILNDLVHTIESKFVAYKKEYVKKIVALPEHFSDENINDIVAGTFKENDTIYLKILL